MRGKMEFKRILQCLLLTLMTTYLVTGCGDLEPEMQDKRTVILNMDFDQRSSSRTSRIEPYELINYKTHLIMVLTSGKNLSNSNYWDYKDSNQQDSPFGEYVLYDSDREITLNMKDDTKMKIFAFLFSENYSHYERPLDHLFSAKPVAGYYGESQIITIDSLTANITLNPVDGAIEDFGDTFGEDDFGGDDDDFGGDTFGEDFGGDTFGEYFGGDTTAPTASVIAATITTSGNAVVQSTETGTAYLVKTTVSVSNNFTSITGAADSQWKSVPIILAHSDTNLPAMGLEDGTYKVYAEDAAHNLSIASSNSVTVATTVTDTTAPVIETVTAVTTPTSDSTPDYTFYSSEAGTITYGGSCATAGSATTNAITGHTLITYNTLSDGSYINCTITVTDLAGNISNTLPVTPFTVNTTGTNVTIDTTLLAHYAFEGNLNDNSSYNRHLTEVGSNITYTAADNHTNKSGRAAFFNGTNTYAYTDNITLSDNFTVAFWTKPDSPNMVQWNSALSTGNSTNSGRFQIDFNTTDNGSIRFCAGSCSMTTTLNSNVWNHIVITKTHGNGENKKVSLYTDGSLRDNQSDITTRWDMIKLGLNRSGGGYWNGYLDEVKIYKRTFSAQEVIDLYESY